MHNFKKALIASLSFLLCFVIMFSILVFPTFSTESLYNDSAKRRELAGSIDCFYSGASHALGSFIPAVIDEKLGTNSYNLSSYACSFDGRLWLIKKELERNPVSTLVLEVSYDNIKDYSEDQSTGEPMTVLKLDNAAEKLSYITKHIKIRDLDKVCSVTLRYGLNAWKARLANQLNIPQSNKGYIPNPEKDLGTEKLDYDSYFETESLNVDFPEVTLDMIREIAGLCSAHDCELILAVVPVSDYMIMTLDNCTEFYDALSSFCEAEGLELYDFNLLLKRFEIFSDNSSFYDSTHMSHTGALAFSQAFAEVMQAKNEGRNTDEYFYSSYAQLNQELAERYK